MSKQAFSYCLSTNKRSSVTINQVSLFGPIIGATFVEEKGIDGQEVNSGNAGNDENQQEAEGQTVKVL